MRHDGRQTQELRNSNDPNKCFSKHREGSVMIRFGDTTVVCYSIG